MCTRYPTAPEGGLRQTERKLPSSASPPSSVNQEAQTCRCLGRYARSCRPFFFVLPQRCSACPSVTFLLEILGNKLYLYISTSCAVSFGLRTVFLSLSPQNWAVRGTAGSASEKLCACSLRCEHVPQVMQRRKVARMMPGCHTVMNFTFLSSSRYGL